MAHHRQVRHVLVTLGACMVLAGTAACSSSTPATQSRSTTTVLVTGSTTPDQNPPGEPGGSSHSAAPSDQPSGPASDPPGSCTFTDWSTDPATATFAQGGTIVGVDGSTDDCFDSVTIRIDADQADFPGYRVEYVPEAVQDGSGKHIDLRGSAVLQVVIDAPAYDPTTGARTHLFADEAELLDPSAMSVVQQVAYAGSFEGQTTYAIGLSSQQPFDVADGIVAQRGGFVTVRILK